MELKDMTLQDVEARIKELDAIVDASENEEEVRAANEEIPQLMERQAELKDLEERKATAKALEEGKIPTSEIKTVEERKGETGMKDIKEFRNSKEYVDAFAEFVKTGKDEEIRALLTTNVGDAGSIAVPSVVEDIIKTAWDKNEIMSLVTKTDIAGNVMVQFEISGDDAVIHDEGSGAISEENLSLGIVTIVPAMIMKNKGISREAMKMRGEAFLRYIYRELAYRITKKLADITVEKIAALPSSATATSPSAAAVTAAPAMATVSQAMGNLSDEAVNPVIIMNKLTWSSFKAVQYANGYGADPFEGLKVKFSSKLPAYSAANEGDVYMIVGDLGFGAQANFPGGEGIDFIFDEITQKNKGIVDITGSQYAGVEAIACKAFALVKKPATL